MQRNETENREEKWFYAEDYFTSEHRYTRRKLNMENGIYIILLARNNYFIQRRANEIGRELWIQMLECTYYLGIETTPSLERFLRVVELASLFSPPVHLRSGLRLIGVLCFVIFRSVAFLSPLAFRSNALGLQFDSKFDSSDGWLPVCSSMDCDSLSRRPLIDEDRCWNYFQNSTRGAK